MIDGVKKLFHAVINAKIPCVAIAGVMIGREMVKNVLNSLQPSIRAASTSETDNAPFMYWHI
jgi:hypothetical protein